MAESSRREMRYPWSGTTRDPKGCRLLARGGFETLTAEFMSYLRKQDAQGVLAGTRRHTLGPGDYRTIEKEIRRTYRALGVWFSGGRRLIRISRPAEDRLMEMPGTRWGDLPRPGERMYGEPTMLYFNMQGLWEVYVMAVARGDAIAPTLQVQIWSKTTRASPTYPWGPFIYIPSIVGEEWHDRAYEVTTAIRQRAAESPEDRAEVTYEESEKIIAVPVIHIVVNALAAMAAQMINPIVVQTKKDRRQSRKGYAGVKNCEVFRLDENGLVTWKRKIIRDDEANTRGKDQGPRKLPSQYTVDNYESKRWVKHPKPGEVPLAEKQGKNSMLYLVERKVKGSTRGGHVVPKEARLKLGVDDINT